MYQEAKHDSYHTRNTLSEEMASFVSVSDSYMFWKRKKKNKHIW